MLGGKATVVLNPATPLDQHRGDVLGEVDMVLLMTVNPGYSGQKFIPATLPKIRKLRRDDRLPGPGRPHSGGRRRAPDTVDELVAAGVDVFVSGSGIFNDKPVAENLRRLKELMH